MFKYYNNLSGYYMVTFSVGSWVVGFINVCLCVSAAAHVVLTSQRLKEVAIVKL